MEDNYFVLFKSYKKTIALVFKRPMMYSKQTRLVQYVHIVAENDSVFCMCLSVVS